MDTKPKESSQEKPKESSQEKPKKRKRPSLATLERWTYDDDAEATDGCRVEPDGTCPHGKKSWLLELGFL